MMVSCKWVLEFGRLLDNRSCVHHFTEGPATSDYVSNRIIGQNCIDLFYNTFKSLEKD